MRSRRLPPETMSVMFSFGLEPDLRFAEAESGGVCFSVPPCPIGTKSLQIKSIGPADLDLEFSIPIFVIHGEEDFHNSDRTRSTILGIDQGAAQGVRVDQRRWALCGVHALRSISTGARCGGAPAGSSYLNQAHAANCVTTQCRFSLRSVRLRSSWTEARNQGRLERFAR